MSAYSQKKYYGDSIKPLVFGSVVHGYALEESQQYDIIREVQLEKLIKSGVKESEATSVVNNAEGIGKLAKERFKDILGGCLTEVVVAIDQSGQILKGKFDAVNLDKNYVVDIKTTSNIKTFNESIEAFNYDIQAAFYLNLASHATGRLFKDFYWAIIDKNNLKTSLVRCSDDAIVGGNSKISQYLHGQKMMELMK